MLLKPFLIYIIAFFGSSVALMTVIKQLSSGFGKLGKKPWVFNGFTSLLSSGLAFGVAYLTQDMFVLFWILSIIYLSLGVLFVLWAHKRYFKATKSNKNKVLVAELIYALSIILMSIAVFIAIQYFFNDKKFLFYPVLCSVLFFFIPILLWHTFLAAYLIPTPVYEYWTYPLDKPIPIPEEKENEVLYVIGFEIAKKMNDKRTYFRAKTPENIPLGELFYHFINDYNEQQSETPVVYTNEFSESYEWKFRTKPKWYQFSRILDSHKTIKENKIRENSVIICERV